MPVLIPNNYLAALETKTVYPAFLFDGEFSGGIVRMWSGVGTLPWNGFEWLGAGELLSISEIRQSANVQADGLKLTLSGMPSSLVSLVTGQARHGKIGTVYLGLLKANGTVDANNPPQIVFRGRLDVPEVSWDGETATVSINYESRLVDLQRARERRYTHEDQQIDFPGDRGFEFVPALQEQVLEW